ncbi:MAG: hypothetical protein ABSG84_16010 [Acidobacteriaceae bacterium]|jgi:hypothetical protein
MGPARSLLAASILSTSILTLTNCGTSISPTTAFFAPQAATTLWLIIDIPNEIYAYPIGGTGATTPSNIITLPASLSAEHIAIDDTGNLYVVTNADIREYAANATGTATPIRVIPEDSATVPIAGLAVDASGNIYVSVQNQGILIFSSTANGNATPSRTILGDSQPGGGLSTIQNPSALATDSAGNLYVANISGVQNSVLVFGPTANGNVAPIRTLIADPGWMAVDPAGNIYLYPYVVSGSDQGLQIAVFAAGATGIATPVRTVAPFSGVYGLAVDPVGNIYAEIGSNPFFPYCDGSNIDEYAPTASGNAIPNATYPGGGFPCSGSPSIAVH